MSSYQLKEIMKFFPKVPSVNKNSERELNPILWPLYLCLFRSFLFSFTDPNKQLPNVKYMLKFLNWGFRL